MLRRRFRGSEAFDLISYDTETKYMIEILDIQRPACFLNHAILCRLYDYMNNISLNFSQENSKLK